MSAPESQSPSKCPICGAPLDPESGGTCPQCLMRAALQATEGLNDGLPQSPPTIKEVAAAFPHLEVLEFVGQGGMGCVFKARQPRLNRLVALKLLPASLAQRDPAFAGRFEREGQLLARLHHPNIVAVHDSGTAGEFFYLTMEYVDGVNLRQAMRARRFTPQQALAIVPLICDALQYAHEEGVLHRDIKPENILLDTKGRVKLADFGIAKLMAEADLAAATNAAPGGTELTQSGAALGTPSYMAPEQRETPQDIDHRADIYSLGVVFYELLTGELPRERFTPPSASSGADPRVDPIVQQALEKNRNRRQRSAGEVRTQLTSLGDAAAPTPGKWSKAWLALAVLLLMLAVVAPLWVMTQLDRSLQARSAQQLARIKEQQVRSMMINSQLADAQASAGRAAARAGNGALPEEFRKEARKEQETFEERARKARVDLSLVQAKLEDLTRRRIDPNGRSWFMILISMLSLAGVGLFLLVRNGHARAAIGAGAVLLVLMMGYLTLRVSRGERHTQAPAATLRNARASFPKYSGFSGKGASAYLAHDDVELHYVVFYAGEFDTSTTGGHNRASLAWQDGSTIKLANGRVFGIGRDSENELFLTINGVEYDLRHGRLFVLKDDGTALQRNVNPSLKEARSLKALKQLASGEDPLAPPATTPEPPSTPSATSVPSVPSVPSDTSVTSDTSVPTTPPPQPAPTTPDLEIPSPKPTTESWTYTPRYLTQERLAEWSQSPKALEAGWFQEISIENKDGNITITGPRDRARRLATMLRVVDQPEPKSLADLPSLNMPPDVFTRTALPDLMSKSDFTKAPLTAALLETLGQARVSASQLARALSAHVLEFEKAAYVNRGVPFEQIVRSPGASTHYEATIPCADRPGQPLTLQIERTTQEIGTQSSFDGFAPWLIEEARALPGEPP